MAKRTTTTETTADFAGAINDEALRRFVDRIERLADDRNGLNETLRAIYAEARAAGFQPPILREIIRERKLDPEVRTDRYALLDAYRRSLGMLAGTPLGEAAMRTAEATVEAGMDPTHAKPRPFAQQTVTAPRRRGRPRKDPLGAARRHLNDTGDELPPAA